MNPNKRTAKRQLGDLGEDLACNFLKKRGFEIIDRNYLKKWGEIDIIAKKLKILHFIEVKSISCENLNEVTHGTLDAYRPEDNMHPWKLKRLARTMQTYLLDKNVTCDWQLDLITVKIDHKIHKAKVEIIENIII